MIEFSKAQKNIIATALTAVAFAVVLTFVGAIVWGVMRLISTASAAVTPVVLGFFLSLFFKPYYFWWKRMVRNPTAALILMLVTVLVPLALLFWHAGAIVVDQLTNLIKQGPELFSQVKDWFHATFPRLQSLLEQFGLANALDFQAWFGELADYGAAAKTVGGRAISCLSGIVTILVALIFFVFFLTTRERRGSEIVAQLTFLKPETRNFIGEQIDLFFSILVSFFQRQTIICLIEGVLYGLGFMLVGLPYGFILGFLLGVLNLIPLFGSVACMPRALPLADFAHDGSFTRLILVIVVWGIGQLLDGYFITPRIQGGKTGLGYAGVIFSFVLWASLLGPFMGMLLAIPLSAFCVVLWRALKKRYIRPVV